MNNDKEYAVAIFSGTLWEAQLIQSLLQNAEIETYLVNALLSAYAYSPARSCDVRIMISNQDIEKAKIILEEYFSNKEKEDDIDEKMS